jgi:hypothetical protein
MTQMSKMGKRRGLAVPACLRHLLILLSLLGVVDAAEPEVPRALRLDVPLCRQMRFGLDLLGTLTPIRPDTLVPLPEPVRPVVAPAPAAPGAVTVASARPGVTPVAVRPAPRVVGEALEGRAPSRPSPPGPGEALGGRPRETAALQGASVAPVALGPRPGLATPPPVVTTPARPATDAPLMVALHRPLGPETPGAYTPADVAPVAGPSTVTLPPRQITGGPAAIALDPRRPLDAALPTMFAPPPVPESALPPVSVAAATALARLKAGDESATVQAALRQLSFADLAAALARAEAWKPEHARSVDRLVEAVLAAYPQPLDKPAAVAASVALYVGDYLRRRGDERCVGVYEAVGSRLGTPRNGWIPEQSGIAMYHRARGAYARAAKHWLAAATASATETTVADYEVEAARDCARANDWAAATRWFEVGLKRAEASGEQWVAAVARHELAGHFAAMGDSARTLKYLAPASEPQTPLAALLAAYSRMRCFLSLRVGAKAVAAATEFLALAPGVKEGGAFRDLPAAVAQARSLIATAERFARQPIELGLPAVRWFDAEPGAKLERLVPVRAFEQIDLHWDPPPDGVELAWAGEWVPAGNGVLQRHIVLRCAVPAADARSTRVVLRPAGRPTEPVTMVVAVTPRPAVEARPAAVVFSPAAAANGQAVVVRICATFLCRIATVQDSAARLHVDWARGVRAREHELRLEVAPDPTTVGAVEGMVEIVTDLRGGAAVRLPYVIAPQGD